MSSLQYDESTIQKIFEILEDNKENVDEKTWLEMCNFMKDVNSFHEIPIIQINGRFMRRTLKPTNKEMIWRYVNQIDLIEKKIYILEEEKKNYEEIQYELYQSLEGCKIKKSKRRIKRKLIKTLEEISDIEYYIKNYKIYLDRYDSYIKYFLTLELDEIYTEDYTNIKVVEYEDASSDFSSDSE